MAFIGTELNSDRKITKCQCVVCGNYFDANLSNAKYCSAKCKQEYIRKSNLEKRIKNLLENGIEGIDYIIDRWNGLPTPKIYGKWIDYMHPGKTIDDYKKEFPGSPIYCQKVYEGISANGGKHMKTEKYRKMFSEKFKGENNPRHHSKLSEQEIKENSPYCDEFYIKRGLPLEDKQKVIDKANKNRVPSMSIQYFLNKGLSEEEAIAAQKARQKTFTLEKCIKKYGEDEGRRIYQERQKKWSAKMEKMYRDCKYTRISKKLIDNFSSDIEIEFVTRLCESMNYNINDVLCAASKQRQLVLKQDGVIYIYDFCNNKRIIEFNGDYWHANPEKYKSTDLIANRQTAKDIWEKDKLKTKVAIDKGFQIMTVWESDYKKDPESVIEKCKTFLND